MFKECLECGVYHDWIMTHAQVFGRRAKLYHDPSYDPNNCLASEPGRRRIGKLVLLTCNYLWRTVPLDPGTNDYVYRATAASRKMFIKTVSIEVYEHEP